MRCASAATNGMDEDASERIERFHQARIRRSPRWRSLSWEDKMRTLKSPIPMLDERHTLLTSIRQNESVLPYPAMNTGLTVHR